MKQAIQTVAVVAIILLALDFVMMIAWGVSGQYPADSFYFGAISRNIIQAIFF